MKTLEEGAKMLIVAWVKDWRMRTLMNVLMDKDELTDEAIKELNIHFPFMPSHRHWYVSNNGFGISAQQFIAQAYPKLSDKLFDLNSNETRLKCFSYVVKQKIGECAPSSRFSKNDLKNSHANNRDYRQGLISYAKSREMFKRSRKSAWDVVK